MILITDLNLTLSEAKYVYERVNAYKLQQKDVSLLLLDHHISGEECAKMFDWYHLDSTKCATKITFETLQDLYPKALESTQAKRFERYSRIYNAKSYPLAHAYRPTCGYGGDDKLCGYLA